MAISNPKWLGNIHGFFHFFDILPYKKNVWWKCRAHTIKIKIFTRPQVFELDSPHGHPPGPKGENYYFEHFGTIFVFLYSYLPTFLSRSFLPPISSPSLFITLSSILLFYYIFHYCFSSLLSCWIHFTVYHNISMLFLLLFMNLAIYVCRV